MAPSPHLLLPGGTHERSAVLAELASTLSILRPGQRLLVGIDGVDGAGKSTFADELALRVQDSRPIMRISLDDFHNPRDIRYQRGRGSPEGFWLDSYNFEQFKDYVLKPLTSGSKTIRDRGHVLETDETVDPEPVNAATSAVVIVDGLFLHREELDPTWDYSIFLDVPFTVTAKRMAVRDGTPVDDPSHGRYVGGQRLYFTAADPASKASLIIENSHPNMLRVLTLAAVSYSSKH
ncbi:hypothetical protein OQA88_1385 [Cercophora sp. LCS_1]